MKKFITVFSAVLFTACVLLACDLKDVFPQNTAEEIGTEQLIILSDEMIMLNGSEIGRESNASVFLSNDIIYYEDRDAYDSGNPYGEGSDGDKHTEEEAEAHTVVNISEAGTYRISGKLSKGQIRIDLGEEATEDQNAEVTLILDNVELNCSVAPAILFLNVYECDHDWSEENASFDVDTEDAGANLILADGSTNEINGSHVARIFKDKEGEKKLWKQDGAIYSYMSMNVDGEKDGTGVLNLYAENEGIDTELHLTINGGNINIYSGNDGINTNEDGISVTTINDGNLHIVAGLGVEGDGIDSNGWLVINGGSVISCANPASDAGLDSDKGSFINGGKVIALGSAMDWAESDSRQVTMNLQFAEYQDKDTELRITDSEEKEVFSYNPSEDILTGEKAREYMGAIVSCPGFLPGKSYHVFAGEIHQMYTGTDVRMHPGMGQHGMMEPKDRKEEKIPPEMPKGERPEMPEGRGREIEKPEIPNGGFPGDEKMGNPVFYMQDKVNCFSGIKEME